MARGSWEDFSSKYGFQDGSAWDQLDFKARARLVECLNRQPEMKAAGLKAAEYNRSGLHNPCIVLILDASEKPATLPAALEERIEQLVEEAYDYEFTAADVRRAVRGAVPGLKFAVRKVDFTDLARSSAFFVTSDQWQIRGDRETFDKVKAAVSALPGRVIVEW